MSEPLTPPCLCLLRPAALRASLPPSSDRSSPPPRRRRISASLGRRCIFGQAKTDEEEFNTRSLSVLMMSVKNNTRVLTESFWVVLELLIYIAIWFLKISGRCGLRCLRQVNGRRRLYR